MAQAQGVSRQLVKKRRADWQEELALARALVYEGEWPVDIRQCQHERWMEGSCLTKTLRCDRRPSWIAIQEKPMVLYKSSGYPKGGRRQIVHRSAISLCRTCRATHAQQDHGHRWLYVPAAPFKAAYRLGGHKAIYDMVLGYER